MEFAKNAVRITSYREEYNRVDWEVTDPFTGEVTHFHTNDNGEGVFLGEDYTKQRIGTADFRLHQKQRSSTLQYLKRWFV